MLKVFTTAGEATTEENRRPRISRKERKIRKGVEFELSAFESFVVKAIFAFFAAYSIRLRISV